MGVKHALRVAAVSLSLLAPAVAGAHDIWLFPERFALSKGETLIVRQLLGTELDAEVLRGEAGEDLPLLRRMTPRFELITPDGSVDLLAELPDIRTRPVVRPVLERRLEFDGLALVVMTHDFIYHQLSGAEFQQYIQHEEFRIRDVRDPNGVMPNQLERYARVLKTLVRVGDGADSDLHKRVLGLTLEILLPRNPYLLDPGDELEVRVLFEGEPLADQLVRAYNSDGTQSVSKSSARTDAAGIARFTLDRAGFWLLRLVYLRPCADQSDAGCAVVDWESHWASFSFELD